MPKKKGRPPMVNTATKKRIIKYMINGDTLTACARKLGVTRTTIYKWINGDHEFAEAVKSSREFAAMSLIDEIVDIADNDTKDIIENELGDRKPNAAAVARSKLQIEARRHMGKYYNPLLFGEKQNIDVTTNGNDMYQGLVITPPIMDENEDSE